MDSFCCCSEEHQPQAKDKSQCKLNYIHYKSKWNIFGHRKNKHIAENSKVVIYVKPAVQETRWLHFSLRKLLCLSRNKLGKISYTRNIECSADIAQLFVHIELYTADTGTSLLPPNSIKMCGN